MQNALAMTRLNNTPETPGERLRKLREPKFGSAAEAARAIGVATSTYQTHENETQGRGFPKSAAERYAKFFGVTIDYLLTGKKSGRNRSKIPVVGYIGAGQEFHPVDDHPPGQGLDLVDPPTGEDGPCVAARIRGNSMHPLKDGWIIFWNKDQDGVPDECIGQLCVVQLMDGRMLVKDLYRGSGPGMFNLVSWNAPLIPDAAVEWAQRVIDIRPT